MKYDAEIKCLYDWSVTEIKDTMDFYIKYAYDPDGGFYGAVTREPATVKDADRGIVVTARIMWTFASAYRVLKDPRYLEMANHAKAYIEKYFIDGQYGGTYWKVHADGSLAEDTKYPYGISFAIYGYAELARAPGEGAEAEAARKENAAKARKLCDALEEHALDKVNGGYFEAYTRDWKRKDTSFNIKDPERGSKALNTHLHLIESYTNLMRVDDSQEMRGRVKSLVDIMTTKLLDFDNYHYKPYMTDEWNASDTLYSFGHDIEAAWLLTETLEAFGDEELIKQNRLIPVKVADACLAAINPDTGGMYYEGNADGLVDAQMAHWVQAEAVVGYLNAYQITRDEKYLKLALEFFEYIKKYVLDRGDGVFREWMARSEAGPDHRANAHCVHIWKGPYHNGRMCLEIIERIGRGL